LVDAQIEWIEKQILSEQKTQKTVNCPFVQHNTKSVKLQWTGTQVELVELIYALLESKSLNEGRVSLKIIFAELGKLLNFNVTDYYRFYSDITDRTSDRTLFLDKLKKAFINRLSKSDNRKF
jgi:hypothetical protein